MARRLLAGTAAAVALFMGGAATASADTIYPTNANTFSGNQQSWTDQGGRCDITLGPVTIPLPFGLNDVSPLVCNVANEYDDGVGNPPGSLRQTFTAAAGLLGLISGSGSWQSPEFAVTATGGVVPSGTFSLDRKATIDGLINVGGNVKYTVKLIDLSVAPTAAGREQVLLNDGASATDAKFVHKTGTQVFPLVADHHYVIRIDTTFSGPILQAALNAIKMNYDNVALRVADGTLDHQSPAGAETLDATGISDTGATLNGAVTPYAEATSYQFQYGTKADLSDAVTTARSSAGAGSGPVLESVALTGLSPCTTYYFRVRAANGLNFAPGTGDPVTDTTKDTLGQTLSFSTYCKPDVQTLDASGVTATSAQLNGLVNPRGPETSYHFDIGTTTDYGASSSETAIGGGTDNKLASFPISTLKPETTYHFRVVATNRLGTSVGADKAFTTPKQSAPGPAGPSGPAGPKGSPGVVSNSNTTLKNGDSRALLIIRSKIARVGLVGQRAGQIRMPIFCKKEVGRSCAGTVKIRTRVKVNPSSLGRKKTPRLVTLATFAYQLQAGKKGYAIATIQPEKLRLMARLKSVKVNLSVQVTDSNNNRQTIVQPGTFVAQRTV